MTDQEIALRELLAKGTDAGVLREMIGFAAERLVALQVGSLTGAAHGERSPDRLAQRNGYRDRDWGFCYEVCVRSRLVSCSGMSGGEVEQPGDEGAWVCMSRPPIW